MKVELNLKTISIVIAIVAILLGLVESTQALRLLTAFGGDSLSAVCAVVLSILGVGGIYLTVKGNLKLAALQYLICGICIFICIYLYGLYVGIIFVIAAIVALIAAYKDKETEVSKDKKLLIIPAVTIILFVLFLGFSVVAGDMEATANAKSVHLSDLSSDIALGYGYYDGHINGNLKLDKDFEYVSVKINFYDKNNVSIADSIGYFGSDVKAGTYKIEGFYFEKEQPVRAEIAVYTEAGSDAKPIYTQTIDL